MRHRKGNVRLGRQPSHRKATLNSMTRAVFAEESITTTKRKAKVAQSFVEKLITIAKDQTPQAKRHVFSLLRDKDSITALFNEIAPRFVTRNGGYTRVIPLYPRRGDGAPMAILELVEKKPKVEPKKIKKGAAVKEEAAKQVEKFKKDKKVQKSEPKPEQAVKADAQKTAPEAKVDAKEGIRKERPKDDGKKAHKGTIFNKVRKLFRRKKP